MLKLVLESRLLNKIVQLFHLLRIGFSLLMIDDREWCLWK